MEDKNSPAPSAGQQRTGQGKQKDKRRIYLTTDGFFNNRPHIKKPRRIAVVDQRRMDGALAVVKIYSAEGKTGTDYIGDLILTPDKHSSLTKNSIVGRQVYIGIKKNNTFVPLYRGDFEPTEDMLTHREYRAVRRNMGGPTRENKRTAKRTIRKWKRGFKRK